MLLYFFQTEKCLSILDWLGKFSNQQVIICSSALKKVYDFYKEVVNMAWYGTGYKFLKKTNSKQMLAYS